MKKQCKNCGIELEIEQFPKRKNYNKTGKQYYKSNCMQCEAKRVAKWQRENAERHKQYMKNYYLTKLKVK